MLVSGCKFTKRNFFLAGITGCLLYVILLGSNYRQRIPFRYSEDVSFMDAVDNTSQDDTKTCSPVQNIGYLKTHKCASTTIQNIIMRYGLKHNLNFVLPSTGNYLSAMKPMQRWMIPELPWPNTSYNIIAHHTVWNSKVAKEILPNNAVFVSMLRDPVDLFESLYTYGALDSLPLPLYIEMISKGIFKMNHRPGSYGRNQMLFDFGLHPRFNDNLKMIKSKIKEIENNFDLIMIAEHFDESMILLKELFCWNMSDIISLKLNQRNQKFHSSLSPKQRDRLRSWLKGDQLLYDHFEIIFANKVEAFGRDRMAIEVEKLHKHNNDLYNACVEEIKDSFDLQPPFKLYSPKVLSYQIDPKKKWCFNYAKSELVMTEELREEQFKRFNITITLVVPFPEARNTR